MKSSSATAILLAFYFFTRGGDLIAAEPVQPAQNPVLQSEHLAMLHLTTPGDITHTAVRGGAWSDLATWKNQSTPSADANVLIPEGITVTVDRREPARLRAVRVEGTLKFAADKDTGLLVDTMIVTSEGELTIGTPEQPVAAGKSATVIFLDRGAIDLKWDPKQMTRGLISHGRVRVCGAPVTPYVTLAKPASAGDTILKLSRAPVNWKQGDKIILPGVRPGGTEDESVAITGINGTEVTIAALQHDHSPALPDLPTYVANLTRNVMFASENRETIARMGHIMFMHSPKVSLAYAAFDHLGRTNKLEPINDVKLDAQGGLLAGTGTNVRGRYAVHFHRTGTNPGDAPASVRGCVVTHSPGWGFVNHSSNVDFDGNVTFEAAGSGFVTEAGDEIGSFRRNLAIYSKGSGRDEDDRRSVQDFGHEGDGFWFQGGGVVVEDNIACGQASSGFIFFTLGLIQDGLGQMRFAVANLWDKRLRDTISHVDHKDPDKINDPETVPVIFVPVRSFKRNTAYACGVGCTTRFLQPQGARSAYEDGLVWNCGTGVRVRYTNSFDLRNMRLVNNWSDKTGGAAVKGTDEGEQDIRYQNLRVEGWPTGILVPEAGVHHVEGGFYNNTRSIVIPTPLQRGRRVEITGDVKFGTLEGALAKRAEQFDIYMDPRFSGLLQGPFGYRDPNVLFASDITLMNGKQIYYVEQAQDGVPFPREQDAKSLKQTGPIAQSLPQELLGKTTREMSQQYGLAIAGAMAPADAKTNPRIHGLTGGLAKYGAEVRPSSVRADRTKGWQFACITEHDKKETPENFTVDLRDGWNLVTRNPGNSLHSFLIFAGEAKLNTKKLAQYDKAGGAEKPVSETGKKPGGK